MNTSNLVWCLYVKKLKNIYANPWGSVLPTPIFGNLNLFWWLRFVSYINMYDVVGRWLLVKSAVPVAKKLLISNVVLQWNQYSSQS